MNVARLNRKVEQVVSSNLHTPGLVVHLLLPHLATGLLSVNKTLTVQQ